MRVFVFDALDAIDVPLFLPLISERRRERVLRLRTESGRKQSVAAELLLRKALSIVYHVDALPEIWLNEHGKPYFTDRPDIFFNLSHCSEGVACGVSDVEIGVDIQDYRPVSAAVIRRVLCTEEQEYLKRNTDEEAAFAGLWSRKEAYLKMTGRGISEGMANIHVLDRTDITTHEFEKYVVSVCNARGETCAAERIGLLPLFGTFYL